MRNPSRAASRKRSRSPASRFQRCLEKAQACLRDAADRWSEGDPEEPSTLEVLVVVLQHFAREDFLYFPSEALARAATQERRKTRFVPAV
jgi:hypothetical protein